MVFELVLKRLVNSGKRYPKLNELLSNVIKLTFLFVSSKIITNLLNGQNPIKYNTKWIIGILFGTLGIAFHESVEIACTFSIIFKIVLKIVAI